MDKDRKSDDSDARLDDLPPEQRERILSVMRKMLSLGIGAVYGDESDDLPDADVDCSANIEQCGAVCCSLVFALTKEEVRRGKLRHDENAPFFIKREHDGYCTHLDRRSLTCSLWDHRPLRCRRYDCRTGS